jgi:nucleotide-binding universal stress UspA family protein
MDRQYEIRLDDKGREDGPRARPIVVGVDGSAQNRGAVDWGVSEAARRGIPLMFAAAHEEYVRAVTMFSADVDLAQYEAHMSTVVKGLLKEVRTSHPDVEAWGYVKPESAVGLLLAAADGAAEVVVGKRGLRAFARLFIGSTSIAVAGRSPVPTVIVPDAWPAAEHRGEPLLVGVETDSDDQCSLAYAFDRAQALGVTLVALAAWETHPALAITPEDRATWDAEVERDLRARLAPWHEKYPDVTVELVTQHAHPAMALLELSEHVQMIVLGRHTAPRRMGGFAFGSVARAVLHYATRPVAVVPETAVEGDDG